MKINPIASIFLAACLLLLTVPPSLSQQSSSPVVNRPVLRVGSQGNIVSELQAALKLLGYYRGNVDGIYSDNTAIAVAQFQRAAGLTADSIVGPNTWRRLFPSVSSRVPTPTPPNVSNRNVSVTNNISSQPQATSLPILRKGMQGDAVKLLQERLRKGGFFSGVVDGIFGLQTLKGVESAQTQLGLDLDGIVGPATWRALLR